MVEVSDSFCNLPPCKLIAFHFLYVVVCYLYYLSLNGAAYFFAGAFVTLPVGSPISPVDTEELVSLLPPNQKYPLEMTATFL